jgi:hypothetical protein
MLNFKGCCLAQKGSGHETDEMLDLDSTICKER